MNTDNLKDPPTTSTLEFPPPTLKTKMGQWTVFLPQHNAWFIAKTNTICTPYSNSNGSRMTCCAYCHATNKPNNKSHTTKTTTHSTCIKIRNKEIIATSTYPLCTPDPNTPWTSTLCTCHPPSPKVPITTSHKNISPLLATKINMLQVGQPLLTHKAPQLPHIIQITHTNLHKNNQRPFHTNTLYIEWQL